MENGGFGSDSCLRLVRCIGGERAYPASSTSPTTSGAQMELADALGTFANKNRGRSEVNQLSSDTSIHPTAEPDQMSVAQVGTTGLNGKYAQLSIPDLAAT
jgi:hypothetical protein